MTNSKAFAQSMQYLQFKEIVLNKQFTAKGRKSITSKLWKIITEYLIQGLSNDEIVYYSNPWFELTFKNSLVLVTMHKRICVKYISIKNDKMNYLKIVRELNELLMHYGLVLKELQYSNSQKSLHQIEPHFGVEFIVDNSKK